MLRVYCKTQWDNAPKRKDTNITTDLRTVSTEIISMLRDIYNEIPASKWTDKDRNTLHRKTGLPHTRTRPDKPIKAICYPSVEVHSNGLINFTVHDGPDSKSLAFPEHADAVEVVFAVIESKIRPIGDFGDRVKKDCKSISDCPSKELFFKSRFSLQLDDDLAGFDLCYYIRFVNTKHPELAGEWKGPFVVRIN